MDESRSVAIWRALSSYFYCSAKALELPKEHETRRRPKIVFLFSLIRESHQDLAF